MSYFGEVQSTGINTVFLIIKNAKCGKCGKSNNNSSYLLSSAVTYTHLLVVTFNDERMTLKIFKL
jgi:hypothetical protein